MAGSQLAYKSDSKAFRDKRGALFAASLVTDSALLLAILFAVDSLGLISAVVLAAYLTMPVDPAAEIWPHMWGHGAFLLTLLIAWAFAGARQQLFVSPRKDSLLYQWFGILQALVTALVVSGFVVAFFTPDRIRPLFVLYSGVAALLFVGIFRTIICLVLWTIHEWGYNARHVLIVGINPRTKRLVETIKAHSRYGYQLIGLLESEPSRVEILRDHDIPYLGKFEELEKILTERIVDEVHVCLPVRSCYEIIQSIAHLCVGVGVSVRLVADLFPLRLATSRVYSLADIPMLSLSTVPESSLQLGIKRAFDVAVSLVGLAVLSPVFLLVAVAIKLDSRGPVLYSQLRVGMNQRRLKMLKFRSMVQDAEERRAEVEHLNELEGPIFKIQNDPRITRVGRFLRKFSIDEFPQLINVLKGEMSLVGPRPALPSEVEQYTWDQRRRLSVKPGMTGLWQVSGRSDVGFKEWVEFDLEYIDNWSLYQDFRILLKTLAVVALAKGAV